MSSFESDLHALIIAWKNKGDDMASMLVALRLEHDAMAELLGSVNRLAALSDGPDNSQADGGSNG